MARQKHGISVIIPTFNRVKFLYSTLICLLNQRINENIKYEIIIIDSGSDATERLVNNFQSSYDIPIIYKRITKTNNRSLIRNEGVKLSSYDILCFLDNDMLVSPFFIQMHYNRHKTQHRLILIGTRRFLSEFDIVTYGEEALIDDFNSLSKLPWYKEVYLFGNINIEPWRFVYSHSFSIEKQEFEKIGKFNIDFGDNWGLEDIELGFRLFLSGCKFELLTNCISYHQPHFGQSLVEQKDIHTNARLFLKLHNCYDVEIYNTFFPEFEKYHKHLNQLKESYIIPKHDYLNKFDLVFACLIDSIEAKQFNNMQLGCYTIFDDDTISKIFILNLFFEFKRTLQLAILSEAFRISKFIAFDNISDKQINRVLSLIEFVGYKVKILYENTMVFFEKEDNTKSHFYEILLPDLFQPEKRYVYNWLAVFIRANNNYVCVREKKNVNSLIDEDFALNNKNAKNNILNENKWFGVSSINFLASSAMLLSDPEHSFPKSIQTSVFFDDDFLLKYDSLRTKILGYYNTYDKDIFGGISYLSVFNEVHSYRENHIQKKSEDIFICVFMENGFKEDGIDIVLDAFNSFIEQNEKIKLIIKFPNYNTLGKHAFPAHNNQSKFNKLFAIIQKFEIDKKLLIDKIQFLNLQERVNLIQENLKIHEIVKLISNTDLLISVGRNCCVPPQVYIAMLLKKHVILAEHQKKYLYKDLNDLCISVKSKPYSFAKEINLPLSCFNMHYLAFRTNNVDLLNALKQYKEKPLKSLNFEKIKMRIELYLQKIF